jgi:hypothetical protein
MTMQVGFVGSDGIVLASDGRETRTPSVSADAIGAVVRTGNNRCKIYVDDERGIVVACADDLLAARPVARAIIDACPFDENLRASPEAICSKIEEIAQGIIGKNRQRIQLLVVVKNPLWLFRFSHLPSGGPGGGWISGYDWSQNRAAAGDIVNPPMFWSEHYHCTTRTMNELTALAAHLIGSARDCNSAAIDGLDIVKCSTDGFTRLDSIQCDTLRKKAREWDETIREMIFGYGRML